MAALLGRPQRPGASLDAAAPPIAPFAPHRAPPSPASAPQSAWSPARRASKRPRLERRRQPVACESAAGEGGGQRRVVVLGGTGRVGSSTAAALLRKDPDLAVVVASRSQASFDKAARKRPELARAQFVQVDVDDLDSLKRALEGAALVVHTAGPFQRKEQCLVMEAALATRTPYLDVCDDADYSQTLKGYSEQAVAAGVPAITSAGIYPGVSNLMAAHMISLSRREYDSEGRLRGRGAAADSEENPPVEPTRVRYSYYTAGSGGVGPTILETSFLLAGTDVVVYKDGQRQLVEPVTEKRFVDFGRGIGEKPVWLYNLPEVYSTHACCGVPSVSARFGTDPPLWNWAMVAVARLLPKDFLKDRSKVRWFARLSMPAVTLVDPIAGEKVGMLVEVDLADGKTAAGLFTHRKLSDSVGICTAAFARSMLVGNARPGVWFPEQPEAVADRAALLTDAAEGTLTFDLNKPLWQLGSVPKQLGMGLYI